MSSSLQLNQINIPQLNQCDSEKLRYLSPPPRPPPPPVPPRPPQPQPPTTPTTEDIDNVNRIRKKRNDNNMCSHHCHHTRGEQISNDSEWRSGTATKGTVYTLSLSLPSPSPWGDGGKHGDIAGSGGGASINRTHCKGICCGGGAFESVQCASALGDTHHDGGDGDGDDDDGGGGTLTTVDSNFKCVSTLSGRVTCAVLPQPRPLECVHRRCRRTEQPAKAAAAAAASSIQEPSETETPTTAAVADKYIDIGKHLGQASSTPVPTNTSIASITTTSSTNTTTTSWASTSSVSSPPSVQDFAKCLTAEEKPSPSPKRPENSLAKGPLSANSCDFVLSELYFSPFGDIFCYNLNPGPTIGVESLQGLLSDSLGHFSHPKRIFLIANQSSHSQWLSSAAAGANQVTSSIPPSSSSVHKFNYLILSARNLSSVLLFVNNEVVNNLNENLYFLPTPTPTLSPSSSSSSSPPPPPSSTSSSSSSSSSPGVNLRSNFSKSFNEAEKEPQDDEDVRGKASDGPRRRTSFLSIVETTTSPTSLDSYTPQKASHSLLKVSDVRKKIDNNNTSSNNANNDNERQCNGSSKTTAPSTVSDKNTSHLVEDDAFRASQRLKRLEENFKDLTVIRKVTHRQPSNHQPKSVHNDNVSENRLPELTRSLRTQPITLLPPTKPDKDVKNSSPSCNCDSIKLSLSAQRKEEKSSATTTTQDNDIIRSKETSVINSINNNNLYSKPKSDSLCHCNNNFNENKVFREPHANASFVNNPLSCKSASNSKKKDIFYISRPVPSISEFDVRQISDLHFCCNKNNKYCDDKVTFECYDELLDDDDDDDDDDEKEDDEEDGYTDSPLPLAACDNECDNNENVCECNCQKCCLKIFTERSNADNTIVTNNFHCPATRSHEFITTTTTTTTNLNRSTTGDFDIEMRELNGQLRGLLKKPNRPPPARKNRVVFDETRNEFFEADYIILIREDCAYDEEDEEPCTCGEHELVRLCCEEGCQCNYTNEDTRTPQSPKFAPPIEFVDEAALSPPDGYKDNGLKNSLGGALSGHIFGAQHIQQLQVIQRLQQQRAAMLAARNTNPAQPSLPPSSAGITPAAVVAGQQPSGPAVPLAATATATAAAPPLHTAAGTAVQPQPPPPQSQLQPHSPDDDSQPVCTECAECVECAAKQLQDSECTSPQCQEEVAQLSVPTVALVPLHSSSPERRITQKEIIAGEERPKYVLQAQYKPASVTERRIVREATEDITTTSTGPAVILQTASVTAPSITATTGAAVNTPTAAAAAAIAATPPVHGVSESTELIPEPKPPIPPKESSPTQISGILKGGKLWKQESISQSDDMNTSSEDDTNAKRSVRFVTEDALTSSRDGDGQAAPDSPEHDSQINELIPIKKHSTLFTNALRPNSAVRQLFPSAVHQTSSMLTHEALRAFDESKRAGNLLPNLIGGSPGDSDTVRRSIERNILRRSLIKKKAVKSDISLEERIKQLTCDIDESNEDPGQDSNDENGKGSILNGEPSAHRDSPTGEENPQQKYGNDKSFSPSSSVSSSSSGSSSAYKKISDIFNRDKKQEKIMEMEENPIVIIPQECRCPAAPDLGMGIQVPVVHTQIHRTPPRQTEPKRQFLSTLAPLTACVAGQKDDLSYYTLAAAEGNSPANTHFAQYNMGDMEPVLCNDEMRKVAPDVIAGTPGQEQDELAAFAQQEANRTEKIKKRYTNETSNGSSDDDEQNDYGFNKRPSVRGIKPKFSSTNEILQQMQDQLNKSIPSIQNNTSQVKSYTLPKQASSSSINKQIQNVQAQNPQIPAATAISQQQTERTWSFYGDPEQQRIPIDGNMHSGYYHTMPTVFQQTFQGQEETLMYQNCVTMEQHYGRYARSPTRRPESPPPLRNYHQTMVLIPYNAETYSQFAATSVDPKVAQIQRQNILEYQQVTQQTIRVPISYALPAMQLHVVAGRGHATQQYVQHQQQHLPQQQQSQRILAPRYSMPQDGTMGFSERGVPEGAAAVSHTDCKGIVSPTSQANQPQQQQQQQMPNCNQSTVTSAGPPGSVFYAMNV